jgi:Family of unknown function (DUF6325)
MTDVETMGPIDYLIVEFPGNRMTGEGMPILIDLVDRGIIRILDLAFIRKNPDGQVQALKIQDMDNEGARQFSLFHGASSGLLDSDDLREAAKAVEPNSSAGIIIYENTWAAPFAQALRRGGAQVIASGRIPVQALLASIEVT